METVDFTGKLLVAHPSLLDPNFRRAVVFLASHGTDGTMGFILNRPTKHKLSDLIPDNQPLARLGDVPVYTGGPVGQNQLIIAIFQQSEEGDAIRCRHNFTLDQLVDLAAEDRASVRAFVGYSGWGGGQLENELSHSSWIIRPPTLESLDPNGAGTLWSGLVGDLGPWFRLQALAPDDPALN